MTIIKPNLPENRVTLVAVGESERIISSLNLMGIKTMSISHRDDLPACESNHADMRLCCLGENRVAVFKNDTEIIKALSDNGLEAVIAKTVVSGKYPQSAALNVCFSDGLLICRKASADQVILKTAEDAGDEIIDVRQGYTKCAVAVVSRRAFITSDEKIACALGGRSDVLVISRGSIALGDDTDGMIGGCCGLIDKNLLAFCGDVTHHPDFQRIKEFLLSHDVNFVCLDDGILTDIGSILPLKQARF